jgi:hypothetical protein
MILRNGLFYLRKLSRTYTRDVLSTIKHKECRLRNHPLKPHLSTIQCYNNQSPSNTKKTAHPIKRSKTHLKSIFVIFDIVTPKNYFNPKKHRLKAKYWQKYDCLRFAPKRFFVFFLFGGIIG